MNVKATPAQQNLIDTLIREIKELVVGYVYPPTTVNDTDVEAISLTDQFEWLLGVFRDAYRAGNYEAGKHIEAMIAIKKVYRDEIRSGKAVYPGAPEGTLPPAARTAPVELEDAIYLRPSDEKIFKVYHTVHGANVQVAKILEEKEDGSHKFEYQGTRPLSTLTPEMKMTKEQALHYSAVYGVCVRCGRTLTHEKSIERGIGPVCYGKFA